MNKYHYQCKTCNYSFNEGKLWKDNNGGEYERCPNCGCWHYYLTNLSIIKTDAGLSYIDYSSPDLGRTMFSSYNTNDVRLVFNRLCNS